MVKCSMHCCHKHQGTLLKTTFFALPKVKPLNDRKTAKAREGKLKAVISNKQRTAWINVINKSYANDDDRPTQNLRICMHHFHPSAMNVKENGKIVLKIGLNLYEHDVNNHSF